MKRVTAMVFLFLGLTGMIHAQEQIVEEIASVVKPERNIEVFTGYIPNADYKAFKLGVAVNNLYFNRLGAFTNVEFGTDSYFAHLMGITGSVTRTINLYAGLDIFTSHGIIEQGLKHCR